MRKILLLLYSAVITIALVVTSSIPVSAVERSQDNVFSDVTEYNFYYDIINNMASKGIINGYQDGTFKPHVKITRKHAAALISRLQGDSLPTTYEFYEFKDMPKSNPSFDDVKKLQQAGLFMPDSRGNFNPNKALTRAEMARILVVAFDLKVKAKYDFKDVPPSHPYKDDIRALYSNGVTTGDKGNFKPEEDLSREHYAVFMHRAMNLDINHIARPIWINPVSYHDIPAEDVPRPPGYVAKVHEKNNKEQLYKLVNAMLKEKKLGGYVTGMGLRGTMGVDDDNQQFFENRAKMINVTSEEFVKILDWTIKTGEIYDGTLFFIYYDYISGGFKMAGANNIKEVTGK
ncbi:S-layer homology domain-containing protein [Sporosarcina sp.]|uniref:S-layer homology domain-containing protein n=1 Tax=Sporosarcina sp. TaxID=49982 RepID=UPI0026079D89|nr:S-layer homology domain-containing protein [Sporosarcina sp.]